jgi:hypothetical protein
MANEVLADEVLAPLPNAAVSEQDYRAFCAVLESSARGRAFLAEYARRNRHANTEMLLMALDRLEGLVRSQAATSEADRIRQELRALLAAMRAVQPTIDAGAGAIKAAKLAAMIGFVQHHIERIVANGQSPLPAEVFAPVMTEAIRSHLAVVPRCDAPELPIPSPAAQGPAIAVVQESTPPELQPVREIASATPEFVQAIAQPARYIVAPAPEVSRSAAIILEENLFESVPPRPVAPAACEASVVEATIETTTEPPRAALVEELVATPPARVVLAASKNPSAPDDPLALIMALSEAERIALFT